MKTAPIILFCIACICGLLSIMNLSGCGYPAADTVHPKYAVGEKVALDNITLPGTGYTPPLTITKVYIDIYQNWFYDATDKRDTQYYHFIQYQLKRYKGN